MSQEIQNGRNGNNLKDLTQEAEDLHEVGLVPLDYRTKCFSQFKILLYRRWVQTYRNKVS